MDAVFGTRALARVMSVAVYQQIGASERGERIGWFVHAMNSQEGRAAAQT
jgi:hypothetical protein